MTSYGFPRNLRLLNAGDFRHVFEHSVCKAYCPGFLLLAAPGRQETTRLGFVIGKKHVKLAVRRNRFKRIFRESFRLNQHQLPAVDILVLAIKGASQTSPEDVQRHLDKSWQQLNRRLSQMSVNLPENKAAVTPWT
ncbi:ribonuclease P protein component [Marinospirillum celere]|uniref:Ribonuclease P protein component n=1 Tax=Marinospirillum celere TaxID=1122252 RepID=A0A1I1I759_9GAMM|nr:ribonuclease P protein component [Marinospirillum celere]SFC31976.1 ribonuclease P protein component [Marinospirillum celere]